MVEQALYIYIYIAFKVDGYIRSEIVDKQGYVFIYSPNMSAEKE